MSASEPNNSAQGDVTTQTERMAVLTGEVPRLLSEVEGVERVLHNQTEKDYMQDDMEFRKSVTSYTQVSTHTVFRLVVSDTASLSQVLNGVKAAVDESRGSLADRSALTESEVEMSGVNQNTFTVQVNAPAKT